MNRNHHLNGFTLMETLTACAVVLVLCAVIVPALSAAKASAKYSVGIGQLRQVGAAIALYAGDADDTLPAAAGSNCFNLAYTYGRSCDTFQPAQILQSKPLGVILGQYGATPGLFKSPADTMSATLLEDAGRKSTWYEETSNDLAPGSSYEYRTLFGLTARPLTSFAAPSETELLYSLYTKNGDGLSSLRQIQFADGHSSTLTDDDFLRYRSTGQ